MWFLRILENFSPKMCCTNRTLIYMELKPAKVNIWLCVLVIKFTMMMRIFSDDDRFVQPALISNAQLNIGVNNCWMQRLCDVWQHSAATIQSYFICWWISMCIIYLHCGNTIHWCSVGFFWFSASSSKTCYG